MKVIEKSLGHSSQIQHFDVQKVETDVLRILDLEDENRNKDNPHPFKGYSPTAIIAACCYMQVKSEKYGLNMSHYMTVCRTKGFPRPAVGINFIDKWGE